MFRDAAAPWRFVQAKWTGPMRFSEERWIAANEYSSAIGVCVKWKENMTSPFAVPATHENQLPVVITVADCHFLHSSSRAFTLREMITKSERRSHPTSKHRERAAAVAARHYGQIN